MGQVVPRREYSMGIPLLGTGAASYVGPGDIYGSALAWYGLRAFSAATIGQDLVRIIRASDSAEQNFASLANGALNVAGIITFLASTTGKVVTLFDQIGSLDVTQATGAARPNWEFNVVGAGHPSMMFDGTDDELRGTGASLTATQPTTVSAVANRLVANDVDAIWSTTSGENQLFGGGVDTWTIRAGTNLGSTNAAIPDGSFHAFQALFNGTSSRLYVDAALDDVIGDANTDAPSSANVVIGELSGFFANMYFQEAGLWAGNKSASFVAMNANQAAYWGY